MNLIEQVSDYLDEDYNPVASRKDARYENITTFNDDGTIKEQELKIIEENIEETFQEAEFRAEDGDLKQDIPASQAFSDVGRDTDDLKKLGKYFDEKSDTGDDLTRTGPGGNLPSDNYDPKYYTGESTTKLNAATGIELEENPKQIYDIKGTVPEYQMQEDIRIEISDPSGDEEGFIPINIEIEGHVEAKDENQDELEPGDLKNHEGRKDPGTHTNTIKAGEKEIDKLLPVSDIWKTKNDGMSETKQFSFIGDDSFEEAIYQQGQDEEQFNQPSSWIGTVTWNPQSLDATVVMNGKAYNHSGVTGKDYESFKGAPSKGAHWNRFWKGQFPAAFREAMILSEKHPFEFDWIDEDAIDEMRKFTKENGKGKFLLAVVSGDTKTDHRSEGRDKHQRHWTREELIQNIRTGKGKLTDLNHLWPKKDIYSGLIYDANWNFKTDRGEMVLWESDEEILDAIDKGIIDAVSINTGNPRKVKTNCDNNECFIEPTGTVLGELNGVGLAYVVTDPKGFDYNGEHIPAFPPGMDFTKIYVVD